MTMQARPLDACQAADDRGVVGEGAVAGELMELVADQAEVIERVRPLRMARQLRDLPGRQRAEDLRGAHAQLLLQAADFGVDVDRLAGAGAAQFLDLRFQVGDRLFEVEKVWIHGRKLGMPVRILAGRGPPAR